MDVSAPGEQAEARLVEERTYAPSAAFRAQANVTDEAYARAAADPIAFWERAAARLDWGRVLVVPGDERWVPGDHPRSNARLIRRNLIDEGAVAADRVGVVQRLLGQRPGGLVGEGGDGGPGRVQQRARPRRGRPAPSCAPNKFAEHLFSYGETNENHPHTRPRL